MRLQSGVWALSHVGCATGPTIGGGIVDHSSADGIEFDIAITAQYIVFAIYKAGFVASFPKRSCTAMTGIEQGYIASAEALHHAGNSTRRRRGDEQMHMIAHQYIGVQAAIGLEQRILQQAEIAQPVVIVQKAR